MGKKKVLNILFLAGFLLSCQRKQLPLQFLTEYENVTIESGHKSLLVEQPMIKILSEAKEIRGPVKGIKMVLHLSLRTDTLTLRTFPKSKFFIYKNRFYKTHTPIEFGSLKN